MAEKAKDKVKITEFTRHIALYAKGYYQRTTLIEDLKKIIGAISGVGEQAVTLGDVHRITVESFLELSVFESARRDAFWLDLFPKHQMLEGRREMSVEDFVGYLLGFVATIKVVQDEFVLDLGETDKKILLLQKKAS